MATKQVDEADKKNEVIGEHNFRGVAERAIEQYQKKGMIIDALLWANLIGHYNAALDAANRSRPSEGETKSVWEEVAAIGPVVQIQKFSASTTPVDVKAEDMPETMRQEIDRTTVGRIWRARIGRALRWWYGWSPEEALRSAIDASESE